MFVSALLLLILLGIVLRINLFWFLVWMLWMLWMFSASALLQRDKGLSLLTPVLALYDCVPVVIAVVIAVVLQAHHTRR